MLSELHLENYSIMMKVKENKKTNAKINFMANTEKTLPGKPDKVRMQTTQQIFHNLLEIVELYPQYSVSQHLATISRREEQQR